MPYLKLTFADGTETIEAVDGEPRLNVSTGNSVTFHTQSGLVGVSYTDERPDVEERSPVEEVSSEDLTVDELKDELRQIGEHVSGSKAELVQRLDEAKAKAAV